MPLQDILDGMREKYEANRAPEALEIIHRATDDLLRSGIMERVLKPGVQAPHFSLVDINGGLFDSEALLREGPMVVSFYRGIW